jgi:microcystin-dependent protein
MATNYPASLDTPATLKNDATDATVSSLTHPQSHNNLSDAVIAVETELGVNPSGSYADLVGRLTNGVVTKAPSANQVVQPDGDFIGLILKVGASQATARPLELLNSAGAAVAYWNRTGILSANTFTIGGVPLNSTHLSDGSAVLKNPSPSITAPTMSSPAITGTSAAPTPATSDNDTSVATTAFVKAQNYITPASPALTGTPTAPTQSPGTNNTRIATTAFVQAEIAARSSAAVPTGTISAYTGSSAPSGWLLCDGSAVSQATYSDLFGVIGLTFGDPGGGNFNLPDLRGRIPAGKGTGTGMDTLGNSDGQSAGTRRPTHAHTFSLSVGASSGSHSHSLSGSSDGSHSHTFDGTTGTTSRASGSDATVATIGTVTSSSAGSHNHSVTANSSGAHSHTISGSVGSSGMSEKPAYMVANYIIKT